MHRTARDCIGQPKKEKKSKLMRKLEEAKRLKAEAEAAAGVKPEKDFEEKQKDHERKEAERKRKEEKEARKAKKEIVKEKEAKVRRTMMWCGMMWCCGAFYSDGFGGSNWAVLWGSFVVSLF